MITVTHHTTARPERVWAVLADGWTYAAWVVGASRIRAVEGGWPRPGSRIHHSVGAWPLLLSDETVVMASEPERLIRLKAKGKGLGQAVVEVTLHDEGDRTRIEMREDAAQGLAKLIPHPVRQALIAPRNTETLTRLALLAERHEEPVVV
jgi:carbon monoxide dehydrogenase subunit G